MGDTEFLAGNAPFLSEYWPYILGGVITLLLSALVAYFLAPQRQERDRNRPRERGGEREGEGVGEGEREGEGGDEAEQREEPASRTQASAGDAEQHQKEIVSLDKGEHPLDEFDDERPDPSLAPPLHDPNLSHIPFTPERLTEEEMIERSLAFHRNLDARRSVRHFSSDPVPLKVIANIILTAGTSPSGAHSEPWTFVVVKDQETKKKMREIVEQEEYLNYDRRMGDRWVRDLQFVRTTHEKPYLEDAPYVIVVFKQAYHVGEGGIRYAHYYFEISTAIACGILVTAIHNAGLSTVTTTPLNAGTYCGIACELLDRCSASIQPILTHNTPRNTKMGRNGRDEASRLPHEVTCTNLALKLHMCRTDL